MHLTEHFALLWPIACVQLYDCRDSVCVCVCVRERDRDGWILWADVYEVWSKWSENQSSWQRTRSRLEKGDPHAHSDTHKHKHATMIRAGATHTRSDMTHTSSLTRCCHLCLIPETTYCNSTNLICLALSPECHCLSSVQ